MLTIGDVRDTADRFEIILDMARWFRPFFRLWFWTLVAIDSLISKSVQQGVEREFGQPLIMILGTTAAARPIQFPDSTEALSPREVEVLRDNKTGMQFGVI
jgi:hypothetical protein